MAFITSGIQPRKRQSKESLEGERKGHPKAGSPKIKPFKTERARRFRDFFKRQNIKKKANTNCLNVLRS